MYVYIHIYSGVYIYIYSTQPRSERLGAGAGRDGILSYLGHGGGAIPGAVEHAHRAQRRSRQHVGQGLGQPVDVDKSIGGSWRGEKSEAE